MLVAKRKNNFQAGNVIVIAALLVAVISLVIAGHFYWQNQQLKKLPVSTSTPAKTARTDTKVSWETYTNTSFGFSFKHPQDWPKPLEENIQSNSGPLFKQITFGNILVIQAKDDRYNSPYTLSERAPSDNWKDISADNYKAFETNTKEINKTTIYISPSLTSIKVITFDFDPTSTRTMEMILSTFKFTN